MIGGGGGKLSRKPIFQPNWKRSGKSAARRQYVPTPASID